MSIKGNLFVHFEDPITAGTGDYYATDWKSYFDKRNNHICIGNPNIKKDDDCIEFATGIIAVLRGSELIAIWGKVKIV
jgi:hypothetical protein